MTDIKAINWFKKNIVMLLSNFKTMEHFVTVFFLYYCIQLTSKSISAENIPSDVLHSDDLVQRAVETCFNDLNRCFSGVSLNIKPGSKFN